MKKKVYRNVFRKPKIYGKKKTTRYDRVFDDKISEYFREMAYSDDLEQDTSWNHLQDRKIFD